MTINGNKATVNTDTLKKILELAYSQQLVNWEHERQRLDRLPDNPITQAREANAWALVQTIEDMANAIEEAAGA